MRMYSVKVWAQGERTGGQPMSSLALVTVEAEDAEAACVLAVDYADKMAPMTDVRWKSFKPQDAMPSTWCHSRRLDAVQYRIDRKPNVLHAMCARCFRQARN